MTKEEKCEVIANLIGLDEWVIVKQGLYYRHNACGYTPSIDEAWKLPYDQARKYEVHATSESIPEGYKVRIRRAPIPKYFEDLNAMRKAEEWLSKYNWDLFEKGYIAKLQSNFGAGYYAQSIIATPEQRAEAFLATMSF